MYGCVDRPSMVEQRKAEIRLHDSLELVQARADLANADRDVSRLEKLVDTCRGKFVFEKNPQYQTMGYWVLPSYGGNKERFTFFPEVEESGKMLLVYIDQQRRYSFIEVSLGHEDYDSLLPRGLSERQKKDVGECYVFAKAMKQLDDVQKHREKMKLKVRFYEKKINMKTKI